MKLTQIKAFQELMLSGSVSQAARNLNRTQPSVSSLIAGLEAELGLTLFKRQGGRLIPVPEAQELLGGCEQLLQQLDSIQKRMQVIQQGGAGNLQIASMPGPSITLLPELVALFVRDRESINVELTSRSSVGVMQLIASRQSDFGLVDYDVDGIFDNGLIESEVFSFDCYCAIRGDHPLATQEAISPHDLQQEKLATLPTTHPVTQRLRMAFDACRVRPTIQFSAQYFMSLLAFVEKSSAIAIVDPITADSYRPKAKEGEHSIVFRLLVPSIRFDLALIRPQDRPESIVAQQFETLLRKQLNRLGAVHWHQAC